MSDETAQIAGLAVRTALAMDHQDFEAFRTIWTEDTVLEYAMKSGDKGRIEGIENVIAFAAELWQLAVPQPYHFVGAVDVRRDGERAHLHYYTQHLLGTGDVYLPGLWEYDVTAVKNAGGTWRIARLSEIERIALRVIAPAGAG